MAEIALNFRQYLELEKLALGAFAPLDGFMTGDVFNSVVETMRLPNGEPFPLPVTLDVCKDEADGLRGAAQVSLIFNGGPVGTLDLEDIFACDKETVCKAVYGTDSDAHPGVRFFKTGGSHFLGGKVHLQRRVHGPLSAHELTPAETRSAFSELGWKTVAGFQTRNVPHRAHEYLQRVALEHVDGLFLQPLVGRKKQGDYTPEAVIGGYQALIDGFYPGNRVLMGILTTSMRYAGPREAVFHAIVRRNYGCTHFIVGRDHAGVGDFYGKYEAHAMTERFDGELGIQILRLCGPYHCRVCDSIVTEKTCPHEATHPDAVTHISGTDMRRMLSGGGAPAPHLMRPEIIQALRDVPLFIDEEDA